MKNVAKKLILFCGAIFLTLSFLEICLTTYSWFVYPRLTITDESLGWKYKPGVQATRTYSAEITYFIKINGDGFRDNEFSRDNDHFKIMVLGDSMTFGLEADQKSIFTNLLEIKLNSILKRDSTDVMNFGITGFSTGQELLTLRKYAPIYKPDLVLLMLFEGNDFTDNITPFGGGRFAPHLRMEDDNLVFYGTPPLYEKILSWFRDHSVLFFILSNRTEWTSKFLLRRYDVDERGKIVLMTKILEQMFIYIKSQDMRFHIFYITDKIKENNRLAEIQKFFRQREVPITRVPLLEQQRVNGSGHWNAKGHQAVTEIIADQVFGYLK